MIDVEFSRTRLRDVRFFELDNLDRPALTSREVDDDLVTGAHGTVGLATVSVDLHSPTLAGRLSLGAGLEQARHVKPDVEANRFVVHGAQFRRCPRNRQAARLKPSAGYLPPGRR
jgi:hypothetical protein